MTNNKIHKMINPEIVSCDVSFIEDTTTREILQDAINAMDNTEGAWSWILDYKPPSDKGFMFSSCDMQTKICKAMKYDSHSGYTMEYTFRTLYEIAQDTDGWIKKFKENQKIF